MFKFKSKNPAQQILEEIGTAGKNVHIGKIILAILGYKAGDDFEDVETIKVKFNYRMATEGQVTSICEILSELHKDGERLIPDGTDAIKYRLDDKAIRDIIDDDEFETRFDRMMDGDVTIAGIWALYRIACYYRKMKTRRRIIIIGSAIILGVVAYKVIGWIRDKDKDDEDEWEDTKDYDYLEDIVSLEDEVADLDEEAETATEDDKEG